MHQNFVKTPANIDFSVNVVLTHVNSRKIIASKIINKRIPCPEDTPLDGVIAANKATCAFTKELREFVISNIQKFKKAQS